MTALSLKIPFILLRDPQVRAGTGPCLDGAKMGHLSVPGPRGWRGGSAAAHVSWQLTSTVALAPGAPVCSYTSRALPSSEITQPPHKHTDIIKTKINQEIKAMFEEKIGAVSIHCLECLPSVPFLSIPAGTFYTPKWIHCPCLDSDHSTNPAPRLHLRSFIILYVF